MPAAWKAMTGNRGRRPLDTQSEARFESGIPECPDFLDTAARAEWDRITPHLLNAGLLTVVDHAQLAMYCVTYARWRLAEQRLQKFAEQDPDGGRGLVTKTPNGFDQLGYWAVISNKCQEQLAKHLAEFGLSPVARARVRAQALQGDLFQDDPMGSFLKAAPKVS